MVGLQQGYLDAGSSCSSDIYFQKNQNVKHVRKTGEQQG